MALNLPLLASQGRAFDAGRAWTDDELVAVCILVKERAQTRLEAADFVRNGILTVEDFDKAQAVGFEPKTLDQAHDEVEASLKENGQAAVAVKPAVKKSKK